MSKRLYVAYGSNLNIRQMKYRCPGAKLYGTGVIDDYELQFKGQPHSAFATIAPKEGACVPVAVWDISEKNEQALDRYEGYPSHYFKQNVPVQLDGEEVNAMVYIMNLKMNFGLPSPYYYQTVYEGYNDCGLDTDVLDKAVLKSTAQFYAAHREPEPQQTLFDMEDTDDFLYEPEDYDGYEPDEDEQAMDENNPFYFSEGDAFMNRKKELQRQLGGRYSYERLLSDREIQRIGKRIPADFSETAAAVLTAGCLRLNAVLYRSCKKLLLGYDVFVKDDPGSPEWIYYDGLSDPVSLKEADMIRTLDRLITERGLSYTESCFKRLDGKAVKKEKHPL